MPVFYDPAAKSKEWMFISNDELHAIIAAHIEIRTGRPVKVEDSCSTEEVPGPGDVWADIGDLQDESVEEPVVGFIFQFQDKPAAKKRSR